MPAKTLLIVDDEEAIVKQLQWAFKKEYDIVTARTLEEALAAVKQKRPAIMTLDLALSDNLDHLEGFQILGEALMVNPLLKVIVITGHDERENAIRAVERGAYDFYTKPVSVSELRVILKRAAYLFDLEQEIKNFRSKEGAGKEFAGIIAVSPPMQAVFDTVSKIAPTDVPVLVTGESGTGKELVAQAIHEKSLRRSGPFVPINCGAIPENLLESELFGHEKGSFTGAHTSRPGKFEVADGGTVFLDEIGELSLSLQVKLLRVLQNQTIEKIGGREPQKVDVRILAATNRNLHQTISEGRFREDLFYRINAISIDLPPLRSRGDDLYLLAMHFLQKFSGEFSRNVRGFSAGAIEAIQRHRWPGNIRELENRMKRAVIMASSNVIQPEDLDLVKLPLEESVASSEKVELHASAHTHSVLLGPRTLKEAREEIERTLIVGALLRSGGNVSNAARELDISRPTLHDLLKKLGIKPEDYRPAKGKE
ncbi:MAG: PEP-CTERM-box response regulator transcription factor [Candidatus Latescibacteria bacterium]|nr:PEP-CTERM-box response regulator transcription factor [Candidatus Latescibacterota bacterium]NIO00947.1 PEP-CTERM-box response regulator transcription factor [Candidatus Latescibacterota bacterium]NIO27346.1 PEP-CTERM-box response regulator transcription factor [Candidatus Latescibacterota bacterium]NIO54868.1 PEP-CTERM-box response regulator transcription factor [Candidatus Latescibacterota bacterium]NIT00957.1 PEP-CTERM-box response regulator transcription factor [Candidatus Latescibactero